MSFYRKIKYFLVHTVQISNKEAQLLIDTGKVEIDGLVIRNNCLLDESSEVKINQQIVRAKKEYVYLKFHKPEGYESTLNTAVKNNLADFFKNYPQLAIAGRLDKQSEGLLLLSNDGKWVEKMCHPKFEKEKEYLVTLNKKPEQDFVTSFKTGVQLGDCITAPCICDIVGETTIKVILTEGKNRQIRRMCHRLGYQVIRLIRIRIDAFLLGNLEKGKSQTFSHQF